MNKKSLLRCAASLAAVLMIFSAVLPLRAFGEDTAAPPTVEVSPPQSEPPPVVEPPVVEPPVVEPPVVEPPVVEPPVVEPPVVEPPVVEPPVVEPPVVEPPVVEPPIGGSDLNLGASDLPIGASDLPVTMGSWGVNISAFVQLDSVNSANGDPIATIKLERIEGLFPPRVTSTEYQTVRFDGGGRSEVVFFYGLNAGTYRVTQLAPLRYKQRSLAPNDVTNGNCSGNSAIFTLPRGRHDSGEVWFANSLENPYWLSDTDMLVNLIELPEGGGCHD